MQRAYDDDEDEVSCAFFSFLHGIGSQATVTAVVVLAAISPHTSLRAGNNGSQADQRGVAWLGLTRA